jgi:hypothetical protein
MITQMYQTAQEIIHRSKNYELEQTIQIHTCNA